jgi:endonuclease/exonuclease/phosphatase family protein
MSTTATRHGARLRTAVLLPALGLLAGALAVVGLGPASSASTPDARRDQPATAFEISSFNLLGAAHTAGGRHGYASGARRMVGATRILDQGGVDVVGFQEMEKEQYAKFLSLRSSTFGIYPSGEFRYARMANSIAWRRDQWALVSARTVKVPYFRGRLAPRPVVLLKNLSTDQLAYFVNTHNPADARGPAQRWRDEAVRIEIDLVNRLREQSPTVPVFLTGDMNDRERFFCPITAATELLAANGGSNVDGVCTVPRGSRIDWILGTRDVAFSNYLMRDDALVNRTTDHPVVMATASIAPAPSATPRG